MADADVIAGPAETAPVSELFGGFRITDLATLDTALAEIAARAGGMATHDAAFWFDPPAGLLPDIAPEAARDPLSAGYRETILARFHRLAASDPACPAAAGITGIGPDDPRVVRPWPYDSGDGAVLGQVLRHAGHVIATCRPRRGHRVLHLGRDPATIALPLARMGCVVTILDPDPAVIAIAGQRASRAGVPLRALRGTARDAPSLLDGIRHDIVLLDAVLRGDDDPFSLPGLTRDHLLAPGGRLVLTGETIAPALPYPWDLDLSAAGLWAIRREGRVAVAFRPDCLHAAMAAGGLRAEIHPGTAGLTPDVVIAARAAPA